MKMIKQESLDKINMEAISNKLMEYGKNRMPEGLEDSVQKMI